MANARRETRVAILRAALIEFEAHGFYATSVSKIAKRVGLSKAAVLYHFAEKSDLLLALAEPLLNGLEAAVNAAEVVHPNEVRWTLMTGVLEVYLAHRALLRTNMLDLSLTSGKVFERFKAAMMRANVLVAGPSPDRTSLIRAAQALASLGDPIVLYADMPTDVLREGVLSGVRKLFDDAPVATPKSRRGRKSLMSDATVKEAKRLYAKGQSADAIAKKMKLSRATIYRHLDVVE